MDTLTSRLIAPIAATWRGEKFWLNRKMNVIIGTHKITASNKMAAVCFAFTGWRSSMFDPFYLSVPGESSPNRTRSRFLASQSLPKPNLGLGTSCRPTALDPLQQGCRFELIFLIDIATTHRDGLFEKPDSSSVTSCVLRVKLCKH